MGIITAIIGLSIVVGIVVLAAVVVGLNWAVQDLTEEVLAHIESTKTTNNNQEEEQ